MNLVIQFTPIKSKIITPLPENINNQLFEFLSFKGTNYFFSGKYQTGKWDGVTRLYNKKNQTFRSGFVIKVAYFLQELGIGVEVQNYPSPWPYQRKRLTFELRPYQLEVVKSILTYRYGIIVSPPRSGKAQPLYSKIRVPGGWIKMGEVKIGDTISTPDNGTAKVLNIFSQGLRPVYRITFEDGRTTDCDKEHLWKVFNRRYWHTKCERVLSLERIIKFKEDSKIQLYIPLPKPIENVSKVLPIDPYVLGLLIGDGCIINNIGFSNIDNEVVKNLKEKLIPGYKLRKNKGNNVDYTIVLENKQPTTGKKGYYTNAYVKNLVSLGLYGKRSYEKFIPDIYKESTIEQRLELLRGLMDTDGAGDKCGFTRLKYKVQRAGSTPYIGTSSKQLALDIQYIIRSLGGLCKIFPKKSFFTYKGEKKKGRIFYRCSIRYTKPEELYKLHRKADNVKRNKNITLRCRIKSIEYLGEKETQCIEIDHPDHLYITDDFIVTHNTLISAAVFDCIDASPSIFYCRSIDLAIQTFQKFSIGEPDKNILPYLPGIKVGIVGDGKFELGDINIVTIQSAFSAYNEKIPNKVDYIEKEVTNKGDLRAIINTARVVFMDECHEIGGKTSRFILEKSSKDALLKIGLTATPDEGEEDDIRLEEHLGPVIHKVGYSTLIDAGYLLKPVIYMYKLPKITIDGNYQTAYKKGVVENQFLNFLVKKLVNTLTGLGHSVVIQTEYRNHTEKLAKFLDVPYLMGQESGDRRAKVLQDLRDKKIMCLVSTVIEQGNDIGSLGFTINLCGQKKRRITIQRMRSTTKVEGKTVCGVIDFMHQCNYLKEHSNKRLQIYKSEPAFEIHIRDVSKKTIEDLL
jgi:superfamily II DNA or RNA helicase